MLQQPDSLKELTQARWFRGSATILIVDDSPEDREVIRAHLAKAAVAEGLHLQFAESECGEDGLESYASHKPDCVLLDNHLPDMDALHFLDCLRTTGGDIPVPVVILTGSANRALAASTLQGGAHEYLPKRYIGPEMLLRAVESARDRFHLNIRKHAVENALRTSEARLRAIFNGTFTFIALLAPDGVLLNANQALLDFIGTTAEAVIGRPFWEPPCWRTSPEARLRLFQAVSEVAVGRFIRFDVEQEAGGGRPVCIDFSLCPVHAPDGSVAYLVAEGRDVTAHRRAERALAENEERLRLTQEAANVGTWEWDMTNDQGYWSGETYALHGLTPTSNKPRHAIWLSTVHPDDRDRTEAAINSAARLGTPYEIEYRVSLPDGNIRWISSRGSMKTDAAGGQRRLLGISLDVTERHRVADRLAQINAELDRRVTERTAELVDETHRRLEAEALLHQSQKMEAIGQLTGGIAHDFNNVLQIIVGNLDLATRWLGEQPPQASMPADRLDVLQRPLSSAQKAANSGAQLTQRLLSFARRQVLLPTQIDPNHFVSGLSDLIRRTLDPSIVVETVLAPDLWPIFADGNQLEAASLNLIVNARDAMPSGGRLLIETTNTILDEQQTRHVNDVPPGPYVLISITDTGCGIAKDALQHVFEPFFTTKPTGHGTGLGLAMVYGFVRQSRGHINIDSEIGKGTAVRIYLPRFVPGDNAVDEAPQPTAPADRTSLPKATRAETILIVEDDENVRSFVQIALQHLGYRILAAPSADQALEMLADDPELHVDLLFTDLMMPGSLSGLTLARRIALLRPSLPVLFTTGHSPSSFADDNEPKNRPRVLSKPYSLTMLAQTIRESLDAAPSMAERNKH
jgi:PAS domain S-box-containing protein